MLHLIYRIQIKEIMKFSFCEISKIKVAISSKKHVLSKDFSVASQYDIEKYPYYCMSCYIYVYKETEKSSKQYENRRIYIRH